MARKVAESNGVKCYDTFTGFKFMAEKKNALEASGEGKVIFSYEESYGYMLGDYVRDKDCLLYTSPPSPRRPSYPHWASIPTPIPGIRTPAARKSL